MENNISKIWHHLKFDISNIRIDIFKNWHTQQFLEYTEKMIMTGYFNQFDDETTLILNEFLGMVPVLKFGHYCLH